MLTLELPIAPPLNNAFINKPGKGRVKSARYRMWLKNADAHYVLAGLGHADKITVPYIVRMIFPASLRGDLDGRAKLILDWMVSRELIIDDRHCWGLWLEKWGEGELVLIKVGPHAGSFVSDRPRAAA